MGTAFKMRDIDPRDRSALYHMDPPLAGYEWVIARRISGVWEPAGQLIGSSVRCDRLVGLRDVWGTKDHAEAFRTFGYEVVKL